MRELVADPRRDRMSTEDTGRAKPGVTDVVGLGNAWLTEGVGVPARILSKELCTDSRALLTSSNSFNLLSSSASPVAAVGVGLASGESISSRPRPGKLRLVGVLPAVGE